MGDDEVRHSHLKILRHVLWVLPAQRDDIADAVMQSGAPETGVALSIESEAVAALIAFSKLPKSSPDRPVQMHDLLKLLKSNIRELRRLDADPSTVDHAELRRVTDVLIEKRDDVLATLDKEMRV